jgi:uncharacterized CHY-type Zn-finger protein
MSSLQWAKLPTKKWVKTPIYDPHPICPVCQSTESFPIMNMVGSPRHCNQCKNQFDRKIIDYKDTLVEVP